ncbi:MAG TPA: protein kinase [Phycisphaerae bacterium]|nr:protein kinase [Phycisphaerae bacterium]
MAFTFQQGDRPLPGYTIERGVGRGGFGEVYFATSDGGKEVALKYLRDNAAVELRGVAQCLNLKSPHLVAIHDIKQSEAGDSFVIMEYVAGPSLRDMMSEHSEGLGVDKAVYFLREIGKGLAYLHDCGIVHRDLKPGNIFYDDGYVKIGDYGLAKLMASSQHSGQTVSVGTVHYMAPEVGSGNYDRTIDIYAMGVMLYEMLLGRVPFSGSSMGEVLMKHLTAQPEVDALPTPFPAVIRRALAKDPKDRYQSVREMMDDVFAVEDISRSAASFDTMNLSRVAARVAERVRMDAGARVAVGVGGSSNVRGFAGGGSTPPPPIMGQAGGRDGSSVIHRVGDRVRRIAYGDEGDRFLAIPDSQGFPQRDRATTGLLGVFLGPFGVHRFYTGHNAIGVLQILVTIFTGGIGGIWGIVEGLRILFGHDFRDTTGRSLRGTRPRSMFNRSSVARAIWGALGVAGILASLVMCVISLVAPPEYEVIGYHAGRNVWFNPFDIFLCGACGALGLGVFGLWKASHRGGLTLWRATIRPGVMCFTAAIAGAAFVVQRMIAPANVQAAMIGLFAVFATAFLFFWVLRGDRIPLRASDVYWSQSWMGIFLIIAVLAGGAAGYANSRWREKGSTFSDENANPVQSVSVSSYYRYRGTDENAKTILVRSSIYNQEPLILFAALGVMICSGLEAWHRRSLIPRAAEVAENENACPQEG